VVTRDKLPSVHVEHTFALTRDGVVVVTADDTPPEPAAPAPAAQQPSAVGGSEPRPAGSGQTTAP
jgi:hypothetical protein